MRDGEHIAYCREDLADLADVCARYVEDEQARARIGAGAARFFDEHLDRSQLAGHYLRTLEQRLWRER
jgi:glycosyltransferase involved in cell wall biosynthesis